MFVDVSAAAAVFFGTTVTVHQVSLWQTVINDRCEEVGVGLLVSVYRIVVFW